MVGRRLAGGGSRGDRHMVGRRLAGGGSRGDRHMVGRRLAGTGSRGDRRVVGRRLAGDGEPKASGKVSRFACVFMSDEFGFCDGTSTMALVMGATALVFSGTALLIIWRPV